MADDWFRNFQARAAAMQLDAERHQAECRDNPCERCNRFVCPKCRVSVPEPGKCDSCEREMAQTQWSRLALAATPRAFSEASLNAAWLARLVGPKAIDDARAALESTRVVATGPPGAGKTALVTAMFIGAYFPASRPVLMHVSTYQIARARAVHPLGSGEAPLIDQAIAATLLVLDELGGEDVAYASAVKDVLHERHAQERPTWVTTGVTPKEIADRYGGGIARRVFEDATVFRLTAKR